MVFGLPFATYALYFGCSKGHCSVTDIPSLPASVADLWSNTSAAIIIGWFVFQAALYAFLPATIKQGLPLRDGTKLDYRINGECCVTGRSCVASPPILATRVL